MYLKLGLSIISVSDGKSDDLKYLLLCKQTLLVLFLHASFLWWLACAGRFDRVIFVGCIEECGWKGWGLAVMLSGLLGRAYYM